MSNTLTHSKIDRPAESQSQDSLKEVFTLTEELIIIRTLSVLNFNLNLTLVYSGG